MDAIQIAMSVGGTIAFFGTIGWVYVNLSARIDALFTIVAGVPYKEHKRRYGRG